MTADQPKINGVKVLTIDSLDALQAVCDEMIHVQVAIPASSGFKVLLVPVRMLRPNESEKLELILKEAHPPMKEVIQPDGRKELQYVPTPETLEKIAELKKVARALALWWTCPLFQKAAEAAEILKLEPAKQRQAIFDFVQSKFTDTILEKLYTVARGQEFTLEDRVNFTTPPA